MQIYKGTLKLVLYFFIRPYSLYMDVSNGIKTALDIRKAKESVLDITFF